MKLERRKKPAACFHFNSFGYANGTNQNVN